jgi:hypothetical protein
MLTVCFLQDVLVLGFRFRVRCMSSSADIEVSAVEVGGESKLHEDLSKVSMEPPKLFPGSKFSAVLVLHCVLSTLGV